jgi:uracil permease
MSNIIGHDLTEDPGLHRTLLGDGVASAIGTIFGGQPNTSYGESTAMVGFSRVASVKVVSLAAIMMGLLAFIEPVQVFISAIPSCVFGGCAMILYGYIACSGIKTLMRNKVDLEDNKKLIITSVILTVGVSGVFLFSQSFAGVSLAMVLGVLLNLILRNKK